MAANAAPPPRIAGEETYPDWFKKKIIAEYENPQGAAHLPSHFGRNISQKSMVQNIARWKAREDERGHLKNHKRGLEPGVKFCLDGDELEVLKRLTTRFPDIMVAEMIDFFRAAGIR